MRAEYASESRPWTPESVYSGCLAHEMAKSRLAFRREVALPVVYDDVRFEAGYRIDFLVEECAIVEIKSVETVHPVHVAQVLTYLKLFRASRRTLVEL